MKYVSITGQMRSGTSLLGDIFAKQENTLLLSDQVRLQIARDLAFPKVTPKPRFDEPLGLRDRLAIFTVYLNVTLWVSKQSTQRGRVRVAPFEPYFRKLQETEAGALSVRQKDVTNIPDFSTIYDLFKVILDHYAQDHKGALRMIGNKATRSEEFLSATQENGIFGIHIIRDPRAVITSFLQKHAMDGQTTFRVNNDLDEVISLWRGSYDAYTNPNATSHRLRYEDLAQDPKTELKKMSEYLDEDLSEQVNLAVANSSFQDVTAGKIEKKAVERWREVGNPEVIALVNERLRSEILALGYSL